MVRMVNIALILVLMYSNISYPLPNLRASLLFNREKQETETFTRKIFLKNELTGKRFELRSTSPKNSKRKSYNLYINGEKAWGSYFDLEELSNQIYIHSFFVVGFGSYDYKPSFHGIAETILKFIKLECVKKGKGMKSAKTKNYSYIRLWHKLSTEAKYLIGGKERRFQEVDWLGGYDVVLIISEKGDTWQGAFKLQQGTNIMKFIREISFSSQSLKELAKEMIVTHEDGRVKARRKNSDSAIAQEIKCQLYLPIDVQSIEIKAKDLAVNTIGQIEKEFPGEDIRANN